MSTALEQFRINKKMSHAELARLLNVPRPTAFRWTSGKRKIGPESLAKVAEATGIAPRDLRPDLAEKLEGSAQ